MVDSKRVHIHMSAQLLAQIDMLAQEKQINRSQFIQHVVQLYIMDRESEGLRERLRIGYQIMNLRLAEDGNDEELLENYERQLAEAE